MNLPTYTPKSKQLHRFLPVLEHSYRMAFDTSAEMSESFPDPTTAPATPQRKRGRPKGRVAKNRVPKDTRLVQSSPITSTNGSPARITRRRVSSAASTLTSTKLLEQPSHSEAEPDQVASNYPSTAQLSNPTPLNNIAKCPSSVTGQTPTPPRPPLATASAPASLSSLTSNQRHFVTQAVDRPELPPRAKSDGDIAGPTSDFLLNSAVANMLRKRLGDGERGEGDVGNNYILEVETPSGDMVFKIGVTKGPERVRWRNINISCGHSKVKRQDDPDHIPIRLYKRTEGLIKKELEIFMHHIECDCNVSKHREYYKIKKEVALEVTQRWRKFCISKPYDTNGWLLPFWEHRLRNLRFCDKSDAGFDHARCVERWNQFVNPTRVEALWFTITYWVPPLWLWRWQILAVFQSLTLAIIFSPSHRLWIVFGVVCCGFMLEVGGAKLPYSLMTIISILGDLHSLPGLDFFTLPPSLSSNEVVDEPGLWDEPNVLSAKDQDNGREGNLDQRQSVEGIFEVGDSGPSVEIEGSENIIK